MTVSEIETRMDCRELAEWMAYARFFQPLSSSWEETGVIASAVLAPYSKHRPPKAWDFVPVDAPPQHRTQIDDAILQMKRDLQKQ